jgi:hypothetical protein
MRLVARVEVEELGAACTDAERRAAGRLHDRLRAAGHEAWVETVWVRPRGAWSVALHAALAVVGGLVAIGAAIPGLGVAAIGTLGLTAEALGYPGPLRLAMRRRATQNVLVEPPDPSRVALLIVARYDAAPRGRSARLLPTLRPYIAAAALAVTACAAARVAGVDGPVLGALQLIPTVALLLGGALAGDAALAGTEPRGAAATAVELLDVQLPERFSPGLVLYGGGVPTALRRHLRRERLDPRRALVVELGEASAWTSRVPCITVADAGAAATAGRLAELP